MITLTIESNAIEQRKIPFRPEMSLSEILAFNQIDQLQPTDFVTIELNDVGTYLLTEAMQFHCNLTIIGTPPGANRIEAGTSPPMRRPLVPLPVDNGTTALREKAT